jgi:tRNA G26 N,N-dimethylase Trm1
MKINKHYQNGVIKSIPKKWSDEEILKLLELKKQGKSFDYISNLLNRTSYSCNRKYYKLMKKLDTYNDKHRDLKYKYNKEFLKKINPSTILDVFSGGISWYKKNTNVDVIDNDLKVDGADFKLDAIDFLHKYRKHKFDIVDLDPFGSAFDCFDFALNIAEKGLIITFGEIVGRRFNRQDYVEHRYNINYIDEFNTNKLSQYIEKRGLIFRKKLTPIIIAEMTNISRVYYKIEHFNYGNSGCKYFKKKQNKLF